jgi:hypothetical protein
MAAGVGSRPAWWRGCSAQGPARAGLDGLTDASWRSFAGRSLGAALWRIRRSRPLGAARPDCSPFRKPRRAAF